MASSRSPHAGLSMHASAAVCCVLCGSMPPAPTSEFDHAPAPHLLPPWAGWQLGPMAAQQARSCVPSWQPACMHAHTRESDTTAPQASARLPTAGGLPSVWRAWHRASNCSLVHYIFPWPPSARARTFLAIRPAASCACLAASACPAALDSSVAAVSSAARSPELRPPAATGATHCATAPSAKATVLLGGRAAIAWIALAPPHAHRRGSAHCTLRCTLHGAGSPTQLGCTVCRAHATVT
jgi:hypothetical protein